MEPQQADQPTMPAQPSTEPTPVVIGQNPEAFQQAPKSSGGKKKLFIILGVVVFLLVFLGGGSYALAYDKLPFKIPALQKPLASFFMRLPFAPKTAQYILTRSMAADEKVQKFSLDASIALKSEQFTSMIGFNQLDAQLKGKVDSSDEKNPKFDLHVDVTKEFSMDMRKNDAIVYFKVNKLPGLLLPLMGIDPAKIAPALENWIAYDTTPLDTDARKYLESSDSTTNSTADYTKEVMDLINDKRVQNSLSVSSESLDGVATYKVSFKPTAEVIDLIYDKFSSLDDKGYFKSQEKLSDSIKKFDVEAWFDKKEGYTRKMVVAIDATSDSPGLPSAPVLGAMTKQVLAATDGKAELSMMMSIILSDHGKDITVETPAKSIKPEEFLQLLMQQSTYGQTRPGQPLLY